MLESAARPPIVPYVNPVTRALRAGKVCIGACAISFPGAAAAQISARAGFNFYYFDMEHSSLGYDDVAAITTAAKLAGIVPIAGPTSHADHLVARPLDNGAMGVIVPHVETAEETASIVRWARYAPLGTRGLLNMGTLTTFEPASGATWVKSQNEEILVAVKVESARGIDNIEKIAAVPGLDAILIGPGDLSATLGVPGDTTHKLVQDCIDRMLRAASKHGVAGGPHVGSAADAVMWAKKGARFMSLSFDGWLLYAASRDSVDAARARLGDQMMA
ncbi:MAG: hypothetical protein FJ029_07650 [Actinobacteria bacterium]|nr:hypothetical protein [Actinomycetota bacterium]